MPSKKKSVEPTLFSKIWKIIKPGKFVTISTILFLFLAYMSGLTMVYYHERVHAEIFRHYDINSEVHVNYLTLAGYTEVTDEDWSTKCNEYCIHAQNMTDVVGYHTSVLIFALWLMALFMLWSLIIAASLMIEYYDKERRTRKRNW